MQSDDIRDLPCTAFCGVQNLYRLQKGQRNTMMITQGDAHKD